MLPYLKWWSTCTSEEEPSSSDILPSKMADSGWSWQPITGQYANTWVMELLKKMMATRDKMVAETP